jgi:hypothetical protein
MLGPSRFPRRGCYHGITGDEGVDGWVNLYTIKYKKLVLLVEHSLVPSTDPSMSWDWYHKGDATTENDLPIDERLIGPANRH